MLFPAEQLDPGGLLDVVGSELAHRHSAGYLRQRNPRLYDAVALALGYGVPVHIIAERCHVSENTVRAVAFSAAGSVEESKQELKTNLRKFLHGGSMILAERLGEISLDKLPAALAAINQQLLLLDGQATSITRHESAGTLDDVAAQISAAQEAARQATGRVIDEPPQMGLILTNKLPGETVPALDAGPLLPVAGLAGLDAGEPDRAGCNGKQPDDYGQDSPDDGSPAGGFCQLLYQAGPEAEAGPEAGPEAGGRAEGGGGGGARARGEIARYIRPS